MAIDPLSPIAPARPRMLLLPVGKITRARFISHVRRIEKENVVRLGDVSPDGRPNRSMDATMFSPLACPTGLIVYNISTAMPPDSYLTLFPFELFRAPLIIIGIADSLETGSEASPNRLERESLKRAREEQGETEVSSFEDLLLILEDLRQTYFKALVHRIMCFDSLLQGPAVPEDIVTVPPPEFCKTTTMKTLMCDLTSLLLAEMTTFAKSLQGLPSIESPGFLQSKRSANGYLSWDPNQTGRSFQHPQVPKHHSVSRSESPVDVGDKSHYRMSMPAQPSSAGSVEESAPAGSRATSPPSRTRTPPPTTFDEISGSLDPSLDGSTTIQTAKSTAGETTRELSRERVAVHGFGSGSLNERARNKGKGRVTLVVGGLYLLAGRWEDAVREFVDSANTAKANSDHLWHAKALESILVALIMLAWAGLDFQIPSVCYLTAEKTSSLRNQPGHHAQSNSGSDADASSSATVSHRLVSLQNLVNLLPDLLSLILSLLNRASSFTGENLPQLAYSEFVIRFGKILSTAHNCAGRLDNDALQHLVLNTPLKVSLDSRVPRIGVSPSRLWIGAVLFRAIPFTDPDSGLTTTDRTVILAGIASVLSSLGLQRKKAFVMRELIATLIPGLVQARKLGAAEMGVHPATGLTIMNNSDNEAAKRAPFDSEVGDVGSGIEEFICTFSQVYGVVGSSVHNPTFRSAQLEPHAEDGIPTRNSDTYFCYSNEAVIDRVVQYASLRSFGNHSLKLLALRYCINLCEALPDFLGVLRFTSELLRTAGSGIAPEAGSRDGSASLSREEQIRLATNIYRTISAGKKAGVADIATDYWDEFLIRGVELLAPPIWKEVSTRAWKDLDASKIATSKTETTPFIYNPYVKKSEAAEDDRFLVAGEPAEFRITLQNLFDFEIEIEQLRLDTNGVEFVSMEHSTIIGPYRKQTMVIVGIPKAAGLLEISGCVVKVSGCWERRFPIFSSTWTGERESKIGNFGLRVSQPSRPQNTSAASTTHQLKDTIGGPKASFLHLTVIKELPVVVIKDISIPQAAMMLLEGETKNVTLTLQNISPIVPANVLLFSFEDSTTGPLRTAMRKKDTSSLEMYELELLLRQHAFRWKRKESINFVIEPGGTLDADLEVLGKPGLTSGVVQLDYSYFGTAGEEHTDQVFTRQLKVPLTITVNACIEFIRADIIPVLSEITSPKWYSGSLKGNPSDGNTAKQPAALFERLSLTEGKRQYCLLLIDLRNAWPNPLRVELFVNESLLVPGKAPFPLPLKQDDMDDHTDGYTISDVLQPGHTVRFMLPLARTFLRDAHAPIPLFDPANRRQFVVNSNKLSPEVERSNREMFWYRESILRAVQGSWQELDTGRKGSIDLRGIKLNHRIMAVVKIPDLELDMSISGLPDGREGLVTRVGRSKYQVPTDEFVSLKIRTVNRTSKTVHPFLRLLPSLHNQLPNSALQVSKQLLWNGLLQRPLPPLRPEETVEAELSICLLCQGEYEVNASIEEVRNQAGAEPKEAQQGGSDRHMREAGRRIWHAEEACIIVAQDNGSRGGTAKQQSTEGPDVRL